MVTKVYAECSAQQCILVGSAIQQIAGPISRKQKKTTKKEKTPKTKVVRKKKTEVAKKETKKETKEEIKEEING